ncbi:MAG: hypothetical protein D6706_21250 [Chloroflexi bacterium]|nr:MAG: hypothetical protein D6706_21250 [Chloroflexota bacterium]
MKVLVLGTGLQGQAVLYDLMQNPDIQHIVAADKNIRDLEWFVNWLGNKRVTMVAIDATNLRDLAGLMEGVDVAIVLLPPELSPITAETAVSVGCHWLDASYARAEYQILGLQAAQKGIALLPEFGLDPGLDLVMAGLITRELDEVHELYSYGAGIPEWSAADNALKYKVSWTLEGVLHSYNRPARLIQNGQIVNIPPGQIFAPENIHQVEIDGVGTLEAFPNGDAARYVAQLGLHGVKKAGRFTMRWPGHAAFWHVMVNMGFLRDMPVHVGGTAVSPRQFLQCLLKDQLQYRPNQRDLAIVRVEGRGHKNGRMTHIIYELIDRRDLDTGLMAMQRTVGFTLSIGAQMIMRGDIKKRGLLSPLTDIPADILFTELQKRGIQIRHQVLHE